MTDYTHTPIGSGYNTASQINTELSGIEAAIDSKLDSDGGFVTAPIDMNSQKLLNLPDGTNGYKQIDLGSGSYSLAIAINTSYPVSTGLIKKNHLTDLSGRQKV